MRTILKNDRSCAKRFLAVLGLSLLLLISVFTSFVSAYSGNSAVPTDPNIEIHQTTSVHDHVEETRAEKPRNGDSIKVEENPDTSDEAN